MTIIPRGFWDQSQITETASATEVFIPLVTLLYLLTWAVVWGWHRRMGRPIFREGAPVWVTWAVSLTVPFFGILSLVLAVFAFIPGDLWT